MSDAELCPKCGSEPDSFLHKGYFWHCCKVDYCFFTMSTGVEVVPIEDGDLISQTTMDMYEYISLLKWNAAARLEKQLKAAGA